MLVRSPLMEAEQDSSIRIDDLTKVGMARSCLGLAEERLVPFEATRHIAYADDRPGAFHDISPVGLTPRLSCCARAQPRIRRRPPARRQLQPVVSRLGEAISRLTSSSSCQLEALRGESPSWTIHAKCENPRLNAKNAQYC